MNKIGLFYGSTYGMTRKVAEQIKTAFKNFQVDLHDVKHTSAEQLSRYDFLIFGTSAWGVGEMQDDWKQWISAVEKFDFTGKKVALFGLGDQVKFPESFADGLGKLYRCISDRSVIKGKWPLKGYRYQSSLAEKDGTFVGLVLDENNQKEQTKERIKQWVSQVEKEFLS